MWLRIIFPATYLGIVVLLLFEDWSHLAESLDPNRYPFKWIAALISIVGGFFGLLFVLFKKTVFTETEIVHRNLFLQTKTRPYGDVVKVEITRAINVRIWFRDGTKIKGNTGESRLAETMQVLERHVGVEAFTKDGMK